MEKLAKTISIHIISEMEKINAQPSSFKYDVSLETEGAAIIITPTDTNTVFTDAYLINDFSTTFSVTENKCVTAINLVANLELIDTSDDDFHITISGLGEIIITPYAAYPSTEGYGKFIDCVIEDASALITEAAESTISDNTDELAATDIDDTNSEPIWIIKYDLPLDEALSDTSADTDDNIQLIPAANIELAAKYATQKARILAKEDPRWSEADIISIQKQ